MLTGDLKSKIDQIWNAFWSGGIANPIEVIEQITYLLFLQGLDSDQTREENKAARLKAAPVRIYPEGMDGNGRKYDDLRWSRFKNFAPAEMFAVLSERESHGLGLLIRSLVGLDRHAASTTIADES